jgi:2'-5' RNA ligase
MRLFIALSLPKEVSKALAKAKERLPNLPARWVKEENLHLTLAFIGKEERAREVGQVIDRLTPRSIKLKTDGITLLPTPKKPRVLAVKVTDETGGLSDLVKELRKGLQQHHLPFDKKPFNPHITIARLKSHAPRRERDSFSPRIPKIEFMVNKIVLMESRPTPSGSLYRPLKEVDPRCFC